MIKLSFPAAYDDLNYNLVVINVALIPIAAGALKAYEEPEAWLTSTDYDLGYNALAELQIGLADMTSILPVLLGGTGVAAIPAFGVQKDDTSAGQTIASATFTKVTWPTEIFDTNSNFTSSRFTPTVAGKYLLACTLMTGATNIEAGKIMIMSLYKNGNRHKENRIVFAAATTNHQVNLTAVVEANGSTDYFEIYVFHTCTSSITIYANPPPSGGDAACHWSGVRVSA